jgi:hypothetical protein
MMLSVRKAVYNIAGMGVVTQSPSVIGVVLLLGRDAVKKCRCWDCDAKGRRHNQKTTADGTGLVPTSVRDAVTVPAMGEVPQWDAEAKNKTTPDEMGVLSLSGKGAVTLPRLVAMT